MHIERCSCNALIVTFSAKRAKEWRTTHIHEVLGDAAEPPTIVESMSTTERASLMEPSGAMPIGFNSW